MQENKEEELEKLKEDLKNFTGDSKKSSCPYNPVLNIDWCKTYKNIFDYYQQLKWDDKGILTTNRETLVNLKNAIEKFKNFPNPKMPPFVKENSNQTDTKNKMKTLNELILNYIKNKENKDNIGYSGTPSIIKAQRLKNTDIHNIYKYNNYLFSTVFDSAYMKHWSNIKKVLDRYYGQGLNESIFQELNNDIISIIKYIFYPVIVALYDIIEYHEKLKDIVNLSELKYYKGYIPSQILNIVDVLKGTNIGTIYKKNLERLGCYDNNNNNLVFWNNTIWTKLKKIKDEYKENWTGDDIMKYDQKLCKEQQSDNTFAMDFINLFENLHQKHNQDNQGQEFINLLYWLKTMITKVLHKIPNPSEEVKMYKEIFEEEEPEPEPESFLGKGQKEPVLRRPPIRIQFKPTSIGPDKMNQQESSKKRKTKSSKPKSLRKHKSRSASKRNSKLSKSQKRKTRY